MSRDSPCEAVAEGPVRPVEQDPGLARPTRAVRRVVRVDVDVALVAVVRVPGGRRVEAVHRLAGVGELAEETGLRVTPADMLGPIWRRDQVFEFNGSLIDSEEFYLVYRTQRFEPSIAGRTELERSYIHGARWCDATDIAELTAAGEQVYPRQLGELLAAANRLADGAADNGAARVLQPIL